MGFEEVAHTADWSVRVWGKDIAELISESARAMNTLAGVRIRERPKVKRTLTLDTSDQEYLLIVFLTELIYYLEHEKVGFSSFDFKVKDHQLTVYMSGSKIIESEKAIKAVTWHNLKIEATPRGYETEIVFDV